MLKLGDKIEYDKTTSDWFAKRPKYTVTTVTQCEFCGLFYKPSLGHKCNGRENMKEDMQ